MSSQPANPVRFSERLSLLLGAQLDVAMRERKCRVSPSVAKLTLITITDHSNDWGWCDPGHKSVARRSHLSVKSIERGVSALVQIGVLTVERRHQNRNAPLRDRTNRYRVNWSALRAMQVPEASDLGSGDHPTAGLVIDRSSDRVSGSHPTEGRKRIRPTVGQTIIMQENENDDQLATRGLHDDAMAQTRRLDTEDGIKAALEQAGVHGGRARRLARRLLAVQCPPTLIHDAIEKTNAATVTGSRGAYLATLLDNVIEQATQAAAEASAAQVEHTLKLAEGCDKSIDQMTDAEIVEAVKAGPEHLQRFMAAAGVDGVRRDKAFRRELVRLLTRERAA